MAEKNMLPVRGWILTTRDEEIDRAGKVTRTGNWHIAWHELFGVRKEAIDFAVKNKWSPPFRARRGQLSVWACIR